MKHRFHSLTTIATFSRSGRLADWFDYAGLKNKGWRDTNSSGLPFMRQSFPMALKRGLAAAFSGFSEYALAKSRAKLSLSSWLTQSIGSSSPQRGSEGACGRHAKSADTWENANSAQIIDLLAFYSLRILSNCVYASIAFPLPIPSAMFRLLRTKGKFTFRLGHLCRFAEASSLVKAMGESLRRESFYGETNFHPENWDQFGAPRSPSHSGC
jgi:hypothetical protein